MARFRACRYCGGVHQLGRVPDNCREPSYDLRSEKAAPAVQSDNLPNGIHGIVSMADGRHYDSKARYLAEVKARGCEVVGNDSIGPKEDRGWTDREIDAAVASAIEEETQKASILPDHMEGHDAVRGL